MKSTMQCFSRGGTQLHDFYFREDLQIQIICATLHEAWMPPPEGPPLVTAADKASNFLIS